MSLQLSKRFASFMLIVLLATLALLPSALADTGTASINFIVGEVKIVAVPSFLMGDHPVPTHANQVYKMVDGEGTTGVSGPLIVEDAKAQGKWHINVSIATGFEDTASSDIFTARLDLGQGDLTIGNSTPEYDANVSTPSSASIPTDGTAVSVLTVDDASTLLPSRNSVTWDEDDVSLTITDADWSTIVQPDKQYQTTVTWALVTD